MTGSHENWFYLAREDLNFARAGLKDGFFTHVCVLAQQAVEKGMKGWLVAHGKDHPRSHDLIQLRRLMGVDWLDPHVSALKRLSGFYVPLRYPDAIAGSIPEGLPCRKDAEEALRWAEEILAAIEAHLMG